MTNIGVISDTHGLLRPEALQVLHDSAHIIHAGDIGSPEILERLREIAPTYAVRGNVDTEPWARSLPVTLKLEFGRATIFVIHNLSQMKKAPAGIGAVIFGHSHHPVIETRDGLLYFNPGSAGPRRFSLPVSVGKLRIAEDGTLHPEPVPLLPTDAD